MTPYQKVKAAADEVAAKTGKAPEYFCKWDEVRLAKYMADEARATSNGALFQTPHSSVHAVPQRLTAAKNAMLSIGRPANRDEIAHALGIAVRTASRYMGILIQANQVTTDRIDGRVVYKLVGGYNQTGELDLCPDA